MGRVLAIAEPRSGPVSRATRSTIALARSAAELLGTSYDLLVLGPPDSEQVEALRVYGAAAIQIGEHPALTPYLAEPFAEAAVQAVEQTGVELIVLPATTFGKDLAPRLAALLDAGMASDIVGVRQAPEGLVFQRPMFAGKALGDVVIDTDRRVATVRASAVASAVPGAERSPVIPLDLILDPAQPRAWFVGFEGSQKQGPELLEARVVVSGGAGMKGPEHFALRRELARLLGGAVGASRVAVDAGWVPNDWQVGQTGKVVSPDLYIAVGISGATQHLAGMKDSKVIVAINKDPDAPIFEIADYGIVGDLFTVVPALIEQLGGRVPVW
ncbi:MAG: electron transfer flavoprotein subunit alpha/FixB family protein [Deltaproteobacteria bacterium]|nr:electron transfer flavoprotein subunit alpha/FixB family protein [Deltaproteobacteria bacterium]